MLISLAKKGNEMSVRHGKKNEIYMYELPMAINKIDNETVQLQQMPSKYLNNDKLLECLTAM